MGLRRSLNIDLTLTHEEAGWFGVDTRVFLVKKQGESMTHVLMKFLSYVMFYHPELEIERSIGQHYKPDLVRLNDTGDVVDWIDCGATTIKKLDKISKQNPEVLIKIVKPSPTNLKRYKDTAEPNLTYPERVQYLSFRKGFLAELEDMVAGRHTMTAVVTGEIEHLYLSVDGVSLDTPIIRLDGGLPD